MDVYTEEETAGFVKNVILGSPASKSYIIVDAADDKPIGVTSLIAIDERTGTPR